MALSDEQRIKLLESTKDSAEAFLEDMHHIRDLVRKPDQTKGELRRLSAILRRLLVEGDLAAIGAPRIGKVMLYAPDNKPLYRAIESARVEFFASGGAQLFGLLMRAITVNAGTKALPLTDFDPDATALLRIETFLTQRVLYWNGKWVQRDNVIKYVANITSGVHSGAPKTDEEKLLAAMRTQVVVGLKGDGIGIAFKPPDKAFNEGNLKFDSAAIDITLIELFAAARYLVESETVKQLEESIRAQG